MREIEITIDTDGKTEIDLKGFQGQGCSQISDELIKALGGAVEQRKHKGEYYKPKPKAKVKQKI